MAGRAFSFSWIAIRRVSRPPRSQSKKSDLLESGSLYLLLDFSVLSMISVPGPMVEVRSQPPVGAIVLNRPDKHNALSRDMLHLIIQALDDLHQEAKVRAIVLSAQGSTFCAGMDLQEMSATSKQDNAWELWHKDAVLYKEVVEKMLRFPKPIIAAIQGEALAGGCGLVLASDLVIGTPKAALGLPEPRRGLVAGIVAPLLTFRVGGSHAAQMLLTARTFSAEEALRMGVLHEMVEQEQMYDRACELCAEIAESAASAIQLTKRMINETIGEHLLTLLSAGAAASATARTTAAATEGLQAFLEKRDPEWG